MPKETPLTSSWSVKAGGSSGYKLKSVDLRLPKQEFLLKQRQVCLEAAANKRPVTFPALQKLQHKCDPEVFSFIMSLIFLSIDCSDCGGLCCKSAQSVSNELQYISLLSFEVKLLREKLPSLDNYIVTRHRNGNEIRALTYPCPFWHDGKCSVYDDRPIVCRSFPVHELDGDFSFDTGCPGALMMLERLAERAWEFYHLVDNMKRAKEELTSITQKVEPKEES